MAKLYPHAYTKPGLQSPGGEHQVHFRLCSCTSHIYCLQTAEESRHNEFTLIPLWEFNSPIPSFLLQDTSRE